MVRQAQLQLGPPGLDAFKRQPMTAHQRHQHECCRIKVARLARRPLAANVTLIRDHRRLVQRDPESGQVTELIRDALCVDGKAFSRFGGFPAAGVRVPRRIREVMDRDHRLHAALAQRPQDVGIMPDRTCRKLIPRGLDPAPLERESMGVLMQASQQIEIARVTLVLIAGWVGPVAVLDMSRHLFPGPPIIQVIAALNLVGRGGGAPEKPIRKFLWEQGAQSATWWLSTSRTSASTNRASSKTATTPIGPTTAATAR